MKDKLGGKIMTKFVGLRAKSYSYLIDDFSENKKAKGTRKCTIKRKFKFENYKNCLEATQIDNKIKYLHYHIIWNEMKNEMGDVATEEFLGLKPKMYSILASDSSEYKNVKGVKKNVVANISLSDYRYFLLNKICLRHSMNRIQSKNHRVETYEINEISLSCFNNKIYFLNNGNYGLALAA